MKPVLLVTAMMLFIALPAHAGKDDATPCGVKTLNEFYDYAYERNVEQVMELARIHLERALEGAVDGKPAIVLDIDETCLSNRESLADMRYCDDWEKVYAYMKLAKAPAIQPTLEFYRFARERGVEVFFTTGRRERFRDATVENLERAGYTGFTAVYFRANDDSGAGNHKAEVRRRLVESGYDILLNLGDQPGDLRGGFARHTLLVPNPFYTSP